jgi:hypothetical protein
MRYVAIIDGLDYRHPWNGCDTIFWCSPPLFRNYFPLSLPSHYLYGGTVLQNNRRFIEGTTPHAYARYRGILRPSIVSP